MIYPASDSVRQALAEDSKNQLAELGIEVTTEGVDWDTAYTRAESEPLVWGWGAHTPMELYNIYHTMDETGLAEYSPYANETVDKYMDEALAASDLENSYDLWKKHSGMEKQELLRKVIFRGSGFATSITCTL